MYQPIALDYGDEIYISAPTAGIRNYIALRGGIAVEQVLKVPVMILWLNWVQNQFKWVMRFILPN
jgi:hypothetical protein